MRLCLKIYSAENYLQFYFSLFVSFLTLTICFSQLPISHLGFLVKWDNQTCIMKCFCYYFLVPCFHCCTVHVQEKTFFLCPWLKRSLNLWYFHLSKWVTLPPHSVQVGTGNIPRKYVCQTSISIKLVLSKSSQLYKPLIHILAIYKKGPNATPKWSSCEYNNNNTNKCTIIFWRSLSTRYPPACFGHEHGHLQRSIVKNTIIY